MSGSANTNTAQYSINIRKIIKEALKEKKDLNASALCDYIFKTKQFQLKEMQYKGVPDSLRRNISKVRDYLLNEIEEDNIRTGNTEVITDKKIAEFDWRSCSDVLKKVQKMTHDASSSQFEANIEVNTKFKYLIFQPLSDTHFGSLSTDYEHLENFTDEVLKIDNLFLFLVGDMNDGFVNFRNMLAVHQQIIDPAMQDKFLESWVTELKTKILFATWDNHSEFEEKASGKNAVKKILEHNFIYLNGMAPVDIKINNLNYKFAVTHKTRYNSSFNKTHGLKQMARKEIPNADIYVAGDIHDPSFDFSFERGLWQLFIRLGTFKVLGDAYAKRYFSYYCSKEMPCFVLNTETKEIIPFLKLEQAHHYMELKKEKGKKKK